MSGAGPQAILYVDLQLCPWNYFALPLQVLDIREKSLHPNHAEVAASLNNLAVLLKTMGNFDEAEQLYHRSIAIKEKALGQNHPQVSY